MSLSTFLNLANDWCMVDHNLGSVPHNSPFSFSFFFYGSPTWNQTLLYTKLNIISLQRRVAWLNALLQRLKILNTIDTSFYLFGIKIKNKLQQCIWNWNLKQNKVIILLSNKYLEREHSLGRWFWMSHCLGNHHERCGISLPIWTIFLVSMLVS